MTGRVAIVGAGIVGRVLAVTLIERGWRVYLHDSRAESDVSNCSATAAGMLSPFAELDGADKRVCEWGIKSLELWPRLLKGVDADVFFERRGSLAVALPSETEELERLEQRVRTQTGSNEVMSRISRSRLLELEPEIDDRFSQALSFPFEGQIDTRQCLTALASKLQSLGGTLTFQSTIDDLKPHSIRVEGQVKRFDWVLDCRGLSAREDLPLRGVRGELFLVETSDVHFTRPIRLMHRRHPLYVVPRPNGKFILGATCLESESTEPITLRSSLEILSMAYHLHSGFSEARILESRVQLRPAFPDNFPKVKFQSGLLRINGMYRHGFLLSPSIAALVVARLEGTQAENRAETIITEEAG